MKWLSGALYRQNVAINSTNASGSICLQCGGFSSKTTGGKVIFYLDDDSHE